MHLFHIIMHDLSHYVVIFLQLYFSFVLAFMLCLDCLNCCSCFSLNLADSSTIIPNIYTPPRLFKLFLIFFYNDPTTPSSSRAAPSLDPTTSVNITPPHIDTAASLQAQSPAIHPALTTSSSSSQTRRKLIFLLDFFPFCFGESLMRYLRFFVLNSCVEEPEHLSLEESEPSDQAPSSCYKTSEPPSKRHHPSSHQNFEPPLSISFSMLFKFMRGLISHYSLSLLSKLRGSIFDTCHMLSRALHCHYFYQSQ